MSPAESGKGGGGLDFEGRSIPVRVGDTVASALYRAGVRTFSRSFKFHRRRGLYCLTGDCPNCLMTVDGEPAVRTCQTPAAEVRNVARGGGWPSADFDLLSVLWHVRRLLPVGFYYKSMIRPRWLWPLAERLIRRIAGLGPVPRDLPVEMPERMSHHPDLLVIGGGVAGLSAALAAAERGERVVLADEGTIGEATAQGPSRTRIDGLHAQLAHQPAVTILERALAIGIYQGPLVPITAGNVLHLVQPGRVVVATGAVERHAVFTGSDLPGVWLGRGAARLAGVHGLAPGRRVVMVVETREGLVQLEQIRAWAASQGDARVVAVVVAPELAPELPTGLELILEGTIVAARGRGALRSVEVRTAGALRTIACDALVLSLGLQPRDGLLRQATVEPAGAVIGAGDVIHPGCTVEEAAASGRSAAGVGAGAVLEPLAGGEDAALPAAPAAGFVCLCEDVDVSELEQAWHEGFRSTELLKRYATATQGACQGALCHPYLRAFVCARAEDDRVVRATVARPPARPVRLEDLAAGLRVPIEYHTALHERHLVRGARMEWTGLWKRPSNYGDVEREYWAVRSGVSIMDVSTLGKYRVVGADAVKLLERLYPCRIADLEPWRSRYTLLLNEAGYIFDDGLACSLGEDGFYLTFTSAGADSAESWLREWAEEWRLEVQIANQTASMSAINVAGPRTRELLARLTVDRIDAQAIPYGGLRRITVAGVPCLAIRVGFVGELSLELHHPSRRSETLWEALLDAGKELDVRPHGLDALKTLRLEKGHFIIGMDTDFDSTPAKVGAAWAVKMEKPDFLGRAALERIARLPRERSLLPLAFAGPRAPEEGAQLFVDGAHVGNLTSSRFSPVLGIGVALGWVRHPAGAPPATLVARDTRGEIAGRVTKAPFYDPAGERLRA